MMKTKAKEVCPVCGEGHLTKVEFRHLTTIEDLTATVKHVSHECDVCKGSYATPADTRENRREYIRVRKERYMIPLGCEIRAMRERAEMTQIEAGEIFGGGPVAFSKYEADDLIPDTAMVKLLKLAIQDPSIARRLKADHNMPVSIDIYVTSIHAEISPHEGWDVDFPGNRTPSIFEYRSSSNYSYNEVPKWTQ